MNRQLACIVFLIIGFAISALSAADVQAQTGGEAQRVIVKMHDGVEPQPQGTFASYKDMDAVKTMRLPMLGMVILEIPADWDADALIKELTKDPAVEYGIRDQKVQGQTVRPDDLNQDSNINNRQWGLEGVLSGDVDVNAPRAWAYTTGSTEVVIAVLDTGVDYTNPDLRDNLWVNAAEMQGTPGEDDDGNGFIDDIHGYDFSNNDGDPSDDNLHGTAVAGTIAAQGNNGFGTTGVAWDARLMHIKILGSDNTGSFSNVLFGISYLLTMIRNGINVRIANASFGFNPAPEDRDMLETPLALAVGFLRDNRVLLVAAAGNDRDTLVESEFSGSLAHFSHDNLIAVAASNRNGSRRSSSNVGIPLVDLAAPGGAIYSPFSRVVNFGTDQTRRAGLLFDDVDESRDMPNNSEGWLIGPSTVVFSASTNVTPIGNAWTNDLIPATGEITVIQGSSTSIAIAGVSSLEYGAFDLSAFPATQNHLFINFKMAYDLPYMIETDPNMIEDDTIEVIGLLRLQIKDSSSAWSTLKEFTGQNQSLRWQEFNFPIPQRFHGNPALELRFLLIGIGSPSMFMMDDTLIDRGAVFLDDIGIARMEDVPVEYGSISGTSFAAPFVSGAAALLMSHRPDLNYIQIRDAILNNVRRTPTWEPLVASGGILDLAAALAAVSIPGFIVTPARPVFTNGEPTTLTIALTREPGADTDTADDNQVLVQLIGGNGDEVNTQPPTLTFTDENWHIPQPIMVTVTRDGTIKDLADTTVRVSVVDEESDSAYHGVIADVLADTLEINRAHRNPGIITLGETVTVVVDLNRATAAPIALTLTLTVDAPAYSTEVTGQIAIGEQTTAVDILPMPTINAPVSAQVVLTAIRTDIGTPLNSPQLPALRIVNTPLLRLRLRAFLEGTLQ